MISHFNFINTDYYCIVFRIGWITTVIQIKRELKLQIEVTTISFIIHYGMLCKNYTHNKCKEIKFNVIVSIIIFFLETLQ